MISIIIAVLIGIYKYYVEGLSLGSSVLFFLICFTIAIGINYFFFSHTIVEISSSSIKYKKSGDIGVLPIRSIRKKDIYYEIGFEGSQEVYRLNVFDGEEGGPITLPINTTKIIHDGTNPRIDIYEGKKLVFTNILLNVIPTKIKAMRFEVYIP